MNVSSQPYYFIKRILSINCFVTFTLISPSSCFLFNAFDFFVAAKTYNNVFKINPKIKNRQYHLNNYHSITSVNITTTGSINIIPQKTPLSSFATSLAIIFKNFDEFALFSLELFVVQHFLYINTFTADYIQKIVVPISMNIRYLKNN